MISKAENISEYKYNQSNTNQQYGQSNQSDMTSNTIKTKPRIATVTLPVALTQKAETQAKPDIQEVDIRKINSRAILDSIC